MLPACGQHAGNTPSNGHITTHRTTSSRLAVSQESPLSMRKPGALPNIAACTRHTTLGMLARRVPSHTAVLNAAQYTQCNGCSNLCGRHAVHCTVLNRKKGGAVDAGCNGRGWRVPWVLNAPLHRRAVRQKPAPGTAVRALWALQTCPRSAVYHTTRAHSSTHRTHALMRLGPGQAEGVLPTQSLVGCVAATDTHTHLGDTHTLRHTHAGAQQVLKVFSAAAHQVLSCSHVPHTAGKECCGCTRLSHLVVQRIIRLITPHTPHTPQHWRPEPL